MAALPSLLVAQLEGKPMFLNEIAPPLCWHGRRERQRAPGKSCRVEVG